MDIRSRPARASGHRCRAAFLGARGPPLADVGYCFSRAAHGILANDLPEYTMAWGMGPRHWVAVKRLGADAEARTPGYGLGCEARAPPQPRAAPP